MLHALSAAFSTFMLELNEHLVIKLLAYCAGLRAQEAGTRYGVISVVCYGSRMRGVCGKVKILPATIDARAEDDDNIDDLAASTAVLSIYAGLLRLEPPELPAMKGDKDVRVGFRKE